MDLDNSSGEGEKAEPNLPPKSISSEANSPETPPALPQAQQEPQSPPADPAADIRCPRSAGRQFAQARRQRSPGDRGSRDHTGSRSDRRNVFRTGGAYGCCRAARVALVSFCTAGTTACCGIRPWRYVQPTCTAEDWLAWRIAGREQQKELYLQNGSSQAFMQKTSISLARVASSSFYVSPAPAWGSGAFWTGFSPTSLETIYQRQQAIAELRDHQARTAQSPSGYLSEGRRAREARRRPPHGCPSGGHLPIGSRRRPPDVTG